jgi:hypothetical protein
VNFEAVAALSSASSEATDMGASTLPVGGFLALLFFAARLRLIFAFRFLAM